MVFSCPVTESEVCLNHDGVPGIWHNTLDSFSLFLVTTCWIRRTVL